MTVQVFKINFRTNANIPVILQSLHQIFWGNLVSKLQVKPVRFLSSFLAMHLDSIAFALVSQSLTKCFHFFPNSFMAAMPIHHEITDPGNILFYLKLRNEMNGN